jgi:gluconolactonase
MNTPLIPLCALLSFSLNLLQANADIVAPGATLQKLAGDFAFTEGPASDKDGNVYFTDQPNDRILKWSTEGTLSTYMQPCGRANGLCFDAKGNLWACADANNELWKINVRREIQVVLKNYQERLFNGPNDLWFAPDGGLFFTDPHYKRDYWQRGASEMPQCVYYLPRDASSPQRVIDDLKQPNGIIGTPNGKQLYVADIGAGRTYRYDIGRKGALSNRKLFCEMGSDGLTIDSEGNVYLTSKGVFVFSPEGERIKHIEVPEPWTANVCFGGKDRKTLFITASKGFYSLQMTVRGVNSQ